MIRVVPIDAYRRCDLASCSEKATREFAIRGRNARVRRLFVCAGHQMEGFARARELL